MFPLHSEMPYIKEDGKRSTLGEMLDQESSDISDLKSRMTTAEGDIDTLEGKMTTAESDIDNLESDVSDLSDAISDAYDETATYAVGDYFIYEDTIYEVITACTGITPPNAEYYTTHNVTDLITTLNSSFNEYNITNIGVYKTTPYSGTTTSSSLVLTTWTVPKTGKYIVLTQGYNSLYGAIIKQNSVNLSYVHSNTVVSLNENDVISVMSPTVSSTTWILYQLVFIYIGDF